MQPYISHTTGEKPANPLIFDGDCWVYYIENVHEYQPPEQPESEDAEPDTQQHWEFTVTGQVPLIEHVKRIEEERARDKEEQVGAILAVDELACECADRLDALEAGGGE